MAGTVGAVATVINTVAAWVLGEDGYAEWNKRRKLAALRKQAQEELARHDFAALRITVRELKRLSNAP